jgi:hypothetical protein
MCPRSTLALSFQCIHTVSIVALVSPFGALTPTTKIFLPAFNFSPREERKRLEFQGRGPHRACMGQSVTVISVRICPAHEQKFLLVKIELEMKSKIYRSDKYTKI